MNARIKSVDLLARKSKLLVVVIAICFSLVVAGCKKDPKVTFIQGTWYNLDAHLANIPGEDAQETSWLFDNGYFVMHSCCFVKVDYSGYYRVIDRSEDGLTLELYNMRGQYGSMILHKDDTLSALIQIDTQADTITINNAGPYARSGP